MNNFLEIIIQANLELFRNWIEQYKPGYGKDTFLIKKRQEPNLSDKFGEVELILQDIYLKVMGTPQKERNLQIDKFFVSTLEGTQHFLQENFGQKHDYALLSCSELTSGELLILVNWAQKELQPYINDLLNQIRTKWPDSRRYILKAQHSPYPKSEKKLRFRFQISIEPQFFLKWLVETSIKVIDSEFVLIQENHWSKYASSTVDTYPPNHHDNFWEFLFLLETSVYQIKEGFKDLSYIENIGEWILFQIVLKPIPEGEYQLDCNLFVEDPKFDAFIMELEKQIRISFPLAICELDQRCIVSPKPINNELKPQKDEKAEDSFIPKTILARKRWKLIWEEVEDEWNSSGELNNCLRIIDLNINLSVSSQTLRKIIEAGERGLLDEIL